jgi:peptidase E
MTVRRKVYLMAGGPGNQEKKTIEQIREAFESSGSTSPAVAYIGTASGDNRTFMKWFERPLRKAGASGVTMVPLLGRKADHGQAEELLKQADVIFLSGGEVEDGMNGLDDGIRALLHLLLEEGKQFLGLSAGSIMMCRAWPHWDDEDHHPEDARLFDCLGFTNEIFDTHAEDEGWPELKKAVELEKEGFVGYGIPAGKMAVIDRNGVLIPNQRLVKVVNRNGKAVVELQKV